MIARRTWLQLAVFALISVVGLTYTGVRYAGLGSSFRDPGLLVSADFADSGGIFEGAEVTYRGVPVGQVEELALNDDGVLVRLRLDAGTAVPDDVVAAVGNRSAVGEQYVDLAPRREGGPFLEDGDTIPREDTRLPVSPTELVVGLDDLVTSIDTDDLAVVLDELGQAFGEADESLQRLVDRGDELTRAATEALPETRRLIRDGRRALDTQRDVAQQFVSFNRDLAELSETLRQSDPDFRRLFANGTRNAVVVEDLLEANRTALPILLSNLVTFAQVQKIRIPAIKQTLVTYPNVIAGGFTVVPGDGTTHFGLVTDSSPAACTEGYETTQERDPADTRDRRPNLTAYCAAPNESGVNVRGAQNAPRPNGQEPYSGPGSYDAGHQGGGGEQLSFADYDPLTGKAVTADGHRLVLGTTAGARRVFGADAWQWLLLGPLTS